MLGLESRSIYEITNDRAFRGWTYGPIHTTENIADNLKGAETVAKISIATVSGSQTRLARIRITQP